MAQQAENNENDSVKKSLKKRKGTWDIRPYLALGLTAILVVLVCLAIFFFIFRFEGFSNVMGKVVSSLMGIIIGFILAYLLNPVMEFFERIFKKHLFTRAEERTKKQNQIIRALAVACAMTVFLAVIVVLLALIIPQLVISIQDLVFTMEEKVEALLSWIERLTRNGGAVESQLEWLVAEAAAALQEWLEQKVLSNSGDIISTLTVGVYNVLKMFFNIIVGIIVAVYVLMTKEKFIGQTKKLIYAIFRPRLGNCVMEVLQKADAVFGGFFIGKIIDSLIIGCICFVSMYIMKLPYPVLISVIVGVTNIIPFFGPYIGAIPSVILIFLVNPIQAVYFLIFIVILQQVDGNIIGPKILGDTTGLSPFWVIFAIMLFGGCFGIAGMIFGVPVFAVIYYIIKRLAEHFLGKKKLPVKTEDYVMLERIDEQTNEIKERTAEKKAVMQPKVTNKNKKKEK